MFPAYNSYCFFDSYLMLLLSFGFRRGVEGGAVGVALPRASIAVWLRPDQRPLAAMPAVQSRTV